MACAIHLSQPWGKPVADHFEAFCVNAGIEIVDTDSGFDFAFGWSIGGRRNNLGISEVLESGKHWLIFDMGYINRSNKLTTPDAYFRVCVDDLNWVYPEKVPGDRWEKFNTPVETPSQFDNTILILGQVPGDFTHKFNESSMYELYKKLVKRFKRDYHIQYKPHPHTLHNTNSRYLEELAEEGVEILLTPQAVEGIKTSPAAVIALTSTSCVEFIRKGTPIICLPQASFGVLGGNILDETPAIKIASIQERENFLHRLAYTQWTLEEIESGSMWRFYDKYIK